MSGTHAHTIAAGVEAEADSSPTDASVLRGRSPRRLITADKLAERWQVPRSQVYRLAREGRVPTVRVGRYMRFHEAAVEAFEKHGA
jgi:excisionase family DNA binding protein